MPEVGPAAALTAPPVPLVSHCGAALPQVALAPHAGAGGGDDDYLLTMVDHALGGKEEEHDHRTSKHELEHG